VHVVGDRVHHGAHSGRATEGEAVFGREAAL
jgi:hypothetical protein